MHSKKRATYSGLIENSIEVCTAAYIFNVVNNDCLALLHLVAG